MNYKLDGISISNYGAKALRTDQAFALHGMLDLPKRIGKTEHNWGTSIEPFLDTEDIKLDGRALTLNVAIKKDQLQPFLDACIACRELEVFDERIEGRNLISNIPNNWAKGYYSPTTGAPMGSGSNHNLLKERISCEPNSYYTMSSPKRMVALQYDGDDVYIRPIIDKDENKTLTFKTHSSARYLRFYILIAGQPNELILISEYKLKIEKGNKPTEWTPAPEDIFFPLPVLCRDEIKVNYVNDYAIVSVPFWQYQVTYNPVTILPSNTGEVRIDGYDLAKDFGIYIASSNELDSVAKRIEVQTTEMYSRTNFRATRTIDLNCTMKVFNTTDLFYKMNEFQSMLMMPGLREFKIRDKNYYVYFKDGMNVEVVANNIAKFNLKATVV